MFRYTTNLKRFIEMNDLKDTSIHIKLSFDGGYVVRFIRNDYIVNRIGFYGKEELQIQIKECLKEFKNLKYSKYNFLEIM